MGTPKFEMNKVICLCGSTIKQSSLTRHLSTKKHLKYVQYIKPQPFLHEVDWQPILLNGCVQQIFELRLVSKEWCDKSFISNFQTGE